MGKGFLTKLLIALLMPILISCAGDSIAIEDNGAVVTDLSIVNDQIILTGGDLDKVISVTSSDALLSGYTFQIVTQSSTSLALSVSADSGNALQFVSGASYHFTLTGSLSSSTLTAVIQNAVPTGSILPFDLSTCPSGWTNYTLANGRVIVGSGSGNVDALGGTLTSRAFGSTGGLEYTTGIPVAALQADQGTASSNDVLAMFFGGSLSSSVYGYTASAADTTLSGSKANSNLPPFIALKYCKKI